MMSGCTWWSRRSCQFSSECETFSWSTPLISLSSMRRHITPVRSRFRGNWDLFSFIAVLSLLWSLLSYWTPCHFIRAQQALSLSKWFPAACDCTIVAQQTSRSEKLCLKAFSAKSSKAWIRFSQTLMLQSQKHWRWKGCLPNSMHYT